MGRKKKVIQTVIEEPKDKTIKYKICLLELFTKYICFDSHWKVAPSAEKEFLELMQGKQLERI
ncbi:hypothetical protein P22_1931 [Propionispora sp. 2/2-37]|uniref:hypothetical protein n=1 Tax=Propionispora sp. 2/2-37 TaxID=1677858 RepID=UPI0006BB8CB8|nr:hypothetical protein [Propionispora sp. 2/2-37]CUH95846.1 hypothetical protein P22_1931 [Propionispora sp. 2/2-37]